MTQIGRCTDHSIMTPVAVLSGHAHHQLLELTVHPWATRVTSPLRPIELARDQPAVPSQNGVQLGRIRYVRERLSPKPMPDLCEGSSVDVIQQQPALNLTLEDAVLSTEILIS